MQYRRLSRASTRGAKVHVLTVFVFMVLLLPGLAAGLPRIAVVDFDTHQYSAELAGVQLADYVMDELVNTGLFDVVERDKLNSVMQELSFGASGIADPSSAAQMGNLLGARMVLTGTKSRNR